MEENARYTFVGLFVVILLMVTIYLLYLLSAAPRKNAYVDYLILMHESVAGLNVKAPVKYNGVPVGEVTRIDLDTHNPEIVRLTVAIRKDIPIRTDTTATLEAQGITGLNYIGLRGGSSVASVLPQAAPGVPLPIIPSRPSLFTRLDTTLGTAAMHLDRITKAMGKLLTPQNLQAIQAILQNTKVATAAFSRNAPHMDRMMQQLDTMSARAAEASKTLPSITRQAEISLSKLRQAATSLQILVGQWSTQWGPAGYQTLTHVTQMSDTITHFFEELDKQPAMLVRGKASSKP